MENITKDLIKLGFSFLTLATTASVALYLYERKNHLEACEAKRKAEQKAEAYNEERKMWKTMYITKLTNDIYKKKAEEGV